MVTKGFHVYELKVGGVASDLLRAEFEDVDLWVVPGRTCLRTGLVDQAALFGLIRRIEDLGLVLLEVEAIDDRTAGDRMPVAPPGPVPPPRLAHPKTEP